MLLEANETSPGARVSLDRAEPPLRHGAAAPDGRTLANADRREVSSGLAASRWGRRVLAWALRRGIKLARRGSTQQALRILGCMARVAPGLPLVQLCTAKLASSLGDMETARRASRAALATASAKAHRYHCRVAALLLGLQELDAAEACLEAASRAFPDSTRVRLLTGGLHRYRGRNESATLCFERALALGATAEDRLQALAGLAGCCADTGRTDEAVAIGRRMIELSPNSAQGYRHLVNCQRGADLPDHFVEPIIQMLGSKSLPRGQRMSLHYSLATVYDNRGEYGEAYAHLMAANGARTRLKGRFNTGRLKRELEGTVKVFDPEFIAAMSKHGCQDDFLICVVGFPRAGTTLTEQILSSHPDVIGLGERSDFNRAASGMQLRLGSRRPYPQCCSSMRPEHIRELARAIRAQLCANAGPHARVVTKSPGDCWHVGLIRILFPKARFVYCQRHPIDNCLSCYMQFFAAISYSTDLATLAEVYRLYRQVMDHWRQVLPPGSLFDCPYEATVADPEPVVRALHEHCAISFNESWAQFYEHARRVDTASLWQVRRPIYQTSVERWKNYARFLGPLLDLEEG
jgi:tetratricopeptide (TPR) repeat protein